MIYALSFELDAQVSLGKQAAPATHTREDVLARFNDYCLDLVDSSTGESAFYGLTEGVMLSEEAHERGYETESWVLDEGMAPHERDWVSQEQRLKVIAYFKDEKSGNLAINWLISEYQFRTAPQLKAEEEQDWNATWKAAFTGIDVDENLRVLPPWSEEWERAKSSGKTKGIIAINPGAGFGTGTHETTQLCLKVLNSLGSLAGKTVLDFGSGSGILGITAALQGAKVYCVEIDPMANENAKENAALNGVSEQIQILEHIPAEIQGGKVDILLANILRPILIRFAPEIKACLKPKAELVLSGLIETDLDQVITTYQQGGAEFKITRYEKNEWRALWLRRGER
jgi:ribosomal protein L11 methyltransferase